jgi:serine/threonine protein kinase
MNKKTILDLDFIENVDDDRLGNCRLYKAVEDEDIQVVSKQITLDSRKSVESIVPRLEQLQSNPSLFVVPLLDYETEEMKNVCSTLYSLRVYMPYPEDNLANQIRIHKLRNNPLSDQDIIYALYQGLAGLAHLHSMGISHGHLNPAWVTRTKIGYSILDDPLRDKNSLYNLESPLGVYLSPQHYRAAVQFKNIGYDPMKSDVFAFGLIMLECGILKSVQPYFVKNSNQVDPEFLRAHLELLEVANGKNLLFVSCVRKLLTEDESMRPHANDVLLKLPSFEDVKKHFDKIRPENEYPKYHPTPSLPLNLSTAPVSTNPYKPPATYPSTTPTPESPLNETTNQSQYNSYIMPLKGGDDNAPGVSSSLSRKNISATAMRQPPVAETKIIPPVYVPPVANNLKASPPAAFFGMAPIIQDRLGQHKIAHHDQLGASASLNARSKPTIPTIPIHQSQPNRVMSPLYAQTNFDNPRKDSAEVSPRGEEETSVYAPSRVPNSSVPSRKMLPEVLPILVEPSKVATPPLAPPPAQNFSIHQPSQGFATPPIMIPASQSTGFLNRPAPPPVLPEDQVAEELKKAQQEEILHAMTPPPAARRDYFSTPPTMMIARPKPPVIKHPDASFRQTTLHSARTLTTNLTTLPIEVFEAQNLKLPHSHMATMKNVPRPHTLNRDDVLQILKDEEAMLQKDFDQEVEDYARVLRGQDEWFVTPQGRVFKKQETISKVPDPVTGGEKLVVKIEYVQDVKRSQTLNTFKYQREPLPPYLMKANLPGKVDRGENSTAIDLNNASDLDTNTIYVDQHGNQYACVDIQNYRHPDLTVPLNYA